MYSMRDKMEWELGHEDRADFDPKNPLANRRAFERDYLNGNPGKSFIGGCRYIPVKRSPRPQKKYQILDGTAKVPFSVKDLFKEILGAGAYAWNNEFKEWHYATARLTSEQKQTLIESGVVFI